MRKIKDLKLNEKLLIGMAIIMIIAIALNWSNFKKGFYKGIRRFNIENINK